MNVVSHRGHYKPSTLARAGEDEPEFEVDEPYQEDRIDIVRPGGITIDLRYLHRNPVPARENDEIESSDEDNEENYNEEEENEDTDMEGHEEYDSANSE